MVNNNYWNIFADKYGSTNPIYALSRKYMDNVIYMADGDEKTLSCSTLSNSTVGTDWYPIIAVSPKRNMEIGEGMSVCFRLKRDMAFGDLNGYNGMVSFCWTNSDATFMDVNNTAIPNSLHYSLYDSRTIIDRNLASNLRGGGYGTIIGSNNSVYGISVTLMPDEGDSPNSSTAPNNSIHKDTTRVSCYKVSYKKKANSNMINFKGYLPKSIDLAADPVVFINESFGKYHIYINGIKICDIPFENENGESEDISSLIDECRFAMCVMGAWDSRVNFEVRNITSVHKSIS